MESTTRPTADKPPPPRPARVRAAALTLVVTGAAPAELYNLNVALVAALLARAA